MSHRKYKLYALIETDNCYVKIEYCRLFSCLQKAKQYAKKVKEITYKQKQVLSDYCMHEFLDNMFNPWIVSYERKKAEKEIWRRYNIEARRLFVQHQYNIVKILIARH